MRCPVDGNFIEGCRSSRLLEVTHRLIPDSSFQSARSFSRGDREEYRGRGSHSSTLRGKVLRLRSR